MASACTQDAHNPETTSRYNAIMGEKVSIEADLYPPIVHSESYAQAKPISGAVNSAGLEDSPFITPDGKTLFFFYTPNPDTPAVEQLENGITGIYRSRSLDGVWSEPERLHFDAKEGSALDGCPTYHAGELWFCSIREGNYRDIDIWISRLTANGWQETRNGGEIINHELMMGEMHLSPDGNTLIYHKPATNGRNDYDLWQVERTGERWGNAEPITPLNSSEDDSRPALSPDGNTLWFTRTYRGTPAIFRSKWTGDSWSSPELMISQFAGEPSIDNEGNIYFTHHFFKDDKMIEADIYVAEKQ